MNSRSRALQVDLDELYPMDTFTFRKGPRSPQKNWKYLKKNSKNYMKICKTCRDSLHGALWSGDTPLQIDLDELYRMNILWGLSVHLMTHRIANSCLIHFFSIDAFVIR